MSSNLYWRPRSAGEKLLDDSLKFALQKRQYPADDTFYERDIPYFEGLRDAGVKDAQKIIDAIEKYGEIEVMERS